MSAPITAAALLVAAADKSGLLASIAEALCFINKHPDPDYRMRELQDALIDAFDGHVCLPAITLEDFYGEGFDVGPLGAAELAPYLKT
jgi:hypothetical protein